MYASAIRSRSRPRARRNPVRVSGTHSFSRHCAAIDAEINGLLLSRQYTIAFNDMIQASDFTSLFDMYRIVKVTYKFQLITVPESNLTTNGTGYQVTNWYPKMWYVVDHDGGATETLSSIRERQGVKCRILRPQKEIKVTFKPMCRVLTYKTADTEGFAPKNIKIDMNDTDVPHYGLAVVFDTNGLDPSDTYPFKVSVERKITF